ncbi:NADPH-dependent 7-cyano-7-deazaguanine reductase QueF [Alteromonas sp. KUL49]|uniref:NADPH-dependent 7-cyano-7-deazaguanine reductase QueF n=1 Tax=Alteromonas sp. KUL49 TaxID=2480798 RepID=UPI00102EF213|nr:NADPH-dependent 7-cyano-7-deazaguanine reductase QueF [Alteromonas sp. KUL49]TAP35020.1 NADPH-dependent 7-cyano-7-deazaguanine reductase QueF [Alteromonas sp. KUL49]GEA13468.1 NADPH-dependent 7-cyano-7-deazaguanine reductase [Alteromonas sp. KUL49]
MAQNKSATPSTSLPDQLTLGKQVEYEYEYNPRLLQPVPRTLGRDAISLDSDAPLPFQGIDTWTGFELSWLNERGKPQIAILECFVPVTSPNLIESKSFKLYLNSFNQTKVASAEQLEKILANDLSDCAGEAVEINLILPAQFPSLIFKEFDGFLLDDLDVDIDTYSPDVQLLSCDSENTVTEETLCSNLLKSNCLITSQPDWASVQIRYSGNKIHRENLLKYLISFRQHNEFHEQCVERIFCDILRHCKPDTLTVCARYTRRGGLDINPFRSNYEQPYANHRQARQ